MVENCNKQEMSILQSILSWLIKRAHMNWILTIEIAYVHHTRKFWILDLNEFGKRENVFQLPYFQPKTTLHKLIYLLAFASSILSSNPCFYLETQLEGELFVPFAISDSLATSSWTFQTFHPLDKDFSPTFLKYTQVICAVSLVSFSSFPLPCFLTAHVVVATFQASTCWRPELATFAMLAPQQMSCGTLLAAGGLAMKDEFSIRIVSGSTLLQ